MKKHGFIFQKPLLKLLLYLILSKVIIKIAKKMLRKVFLVRAKEPIFGQMSVEKLLFKAIREYNYICRFTLYQP